MYWKSLAFLLLILPFPLKAQPLDFYPLGAGQGLDIKVATSLLVDRHGFLWVASREGLFRYDGYQAVPLPTGGSGLPDNDIRWLFEDRDGFIWIATNTSGLSRYDPRTDSFTHLRHASANLHTLSHDSVYGMAQDSEGQIWAGSQIGLNRIDPVSGRVTRFVHDPAQPRSISHDYIYDVLGEPDGGAVWVATVGGGVNRWQQGALGFDHFDLTGMTAGAEDLNSVFALARQGASTLYAGTRGGLVQLDFAQGKGELVDLGGEVHPTVLALEWGPQGRLWIATMARGVLIYDPATGAVEVANPKPLGEDGQLPALPQLVLHFSGDKLLIATWGNGVYMARLNRNTYGWLHAGNEAGQLRHRNVTAVMATSAGQSWVGTFGGGLQRLSDDGLAVEEATTHTTALSSDGILSVLQRRNGQTLAGSNHGLWELDSNGSHRLINADSGKGLGAGYVTSLLESQSGDLWVGVGGSGLFVLPAGHSTFERRTHIPEQSDSLSGNYITALLDLGENLLLVGTRSNGLNLCNTKPWGCLRFGEEQGLGHHNVTALYRDRADDIWVGTDGGGVHRLQLGADRKLHLLRRWGQGDGLLAPGVMGIVEDDDGSIWLSSRRGLSRLQPATGLLVHHVAESGLPVTHFNARAAARDEKRLYFGGINGLVTIPAGTEWIQREPSPVRLVELSRATENSGIQTRPAMAVESVELDWGKMLSVSFASLDFAQGTHQYEYRLRSSEPWLPLGARRELTLLELSPGAHQLSVRGRDVFGSWNESPALQLNVVPPYWMTTWFRGGAVALLIMLALALHNLRMRELRRRNQVLEQLRKQREGALQKAEISGRQLAEAHAGLRNLTGRLQSAKEEQREHIARELHDELGQTLTATKISLQRVGRATDSREQQQRLNESVSMLDRMIGQVRNISLTLRPPLLDEIGLAEALKVHLDSVTDRTGIDIGLNAVGKVTEVRRSIRTVVFRLVQEAVSNALRHADCRRIEVFLEGSDGQVTLVVSDNGRGFDPVQAWDRVQRGEHLGLLGMLERARSVGGEMHFDSGPGRGCRVSAVLPM
ncbi:two-component regulator propeller domain-containing protein [Microbulbifer aggregans]|uniref:sensor histidine kinase n=1 Tax=Microbulbifer aggregans TaxID=1769779 RepID=UPI001CFCE11B|nr:two-component regulator propeller domain-containing protein [Microbulbifer aggregans]